MLLFVSAFSSRNSDTEKFDKKIKRKKTIKQNKHNKHNKEKIVTKAGTVRGYRGLKLITLLYLQTMRN